MSKRRAKKAAAFESGNIRMVATDGHRLAFEEKAVGSFGLTKGVILPRKGLAELKKCGFCGRKTNT
jgi:DNA polymerase III sliding clamp (beta) subunit (PCNA family)